MIQELLHIVRVEAHGTWRYRWSAMVTAWVVCVLGWLFILGLADVYEARSQVFVDADSRLAGVMAQVGVAQSVGSSVFVVRQAMLGQPQLEKVARETGLYLRAKSGEEMELLLAGLREKIVVASGRREQARNLYTIAFRDRDRDMAIAVVQKLLDTFVDDVLDLKNSGSRDVTAYLEDQLNYYSDLLSVAETELAEFKKKYVGLLPGENGGVFERLQSELDAIKKLRAELGVEEDRRNELRRQLRSEEPYSPVDGNMEGGAPVPGSTTDVTIKELESSRSSLLLTYTERHPDVIAINEQLAQLYKQRELDRKALSANGSGIEGAANATNPVYQSVQIALNESGVLIAGMRGQISQREAVLRELKAQSDTIPEVEAKYSELTRNYTQYQSLYGELLLRKERERLGSAGQDSDVVSFNIIEPPSASMEPVAPKRSLFLIAALVIGLGFGGFIAFLVHKLNPVFHDVRTLRQVIGKPVLGVVSLTWLERNRKRRLVDFSSFGFAGISLIVLFAAILLFQQDLEQLMASAVFSTIK